jgi:hypothetical protein
LLYLFRHSFAPLLPRSILSKLFKWTPPATWADYS